MSGVVVVVVLFRRLAVRQNASLRLRLLLSFLKVSPLYEYCSLEHRSESDTCSNLFLLPVTSNQYPPRLQRSY